jgi:hypothetical protein
MIAAAVRRAGMEHALPRLNETHTIRVELPLYQIRLLHWLAVTRSEPVERGAAGAIPNLGAATEFPFAREPPQRGEKSCIYCGGAVPAGRDACVSCVARHGPSAQHG